MKQHITRNQWDELTDEQKHTLKIYFDQEAVREVISEGLTIYHQKVLIDGYLKIGQMIEFLSNHEIDEALSNVDYDGNENPYVLGLIPKEEFCDALWKAVKYKLKN